MRRSAGMKSKSFRKNRSQEIDMDSVEAMRRLTPEERLNAFLTHSRLILELYSAGQQVRKTRFAKPV